MPDAAPEPMGERAVRELREMVGRFAAGEAEIARVYFERVRSPAQDEIWLTSQGGRELSRVYQLCEQARRELAALDQGGGYGRLRDTLKKGFEELNHFIAVAELLELATGRPADHAELRRYDIFAPDPAAPCNGENVKLAEVNREVDRRLNELQPAWAALVRDQGLLEGGGNGLFYALKDRDGDDFERRLGAAMRMILDDEMDHGPAQLADVAALVQTEDDLQQAKELTRMRGEQRLRYRNEQFGHPLSELRLQQILGGDVEPLPFFAEGVG